MRDTHLERQSAKRKWGMRLLVRALPLLALLPLLLAAAEPELPLGTLVLNPNTHWRARTMQGDADQTLCFLLDRSEEGLLVEVGEPNHGAQLSMVTSLHLSLAQTPMLVLSYRASGLDLADPEEGVLLFTGGTPKSVPMVCNADIICDNQPHEVCIDLREVLARHGATDDALVTPALWVRAGSQAPGVFCLMDLRFERDGDGELLLEADALDTPVAVHVTGPDGKPVADALVTLDAHTENLRVEASTDKEGRATVLPAIPGLAGTRRSLEVTKEGMVPVFFQDLRDADAETVLEARLVPAQELSGHVVDEDGKPVSRATGELWLSNHDRPQGAGKPWSSWRRRVFSDADGRWSCPDLPDNNRLTAQVRWTTFGYIQDEYSGQYSGRVAMGSLRSGKAVSTLRRGVVVTGRVTDGKGTPLAGVNVAPGEDRFPSNAAPATKTNADGAFRFTSVPEGEFILTATAEGYAPELVVVKAAAGLAPVEMTLRAPRTFRFRVADPDGTPLPGIGFTVDTWREYRTIPQRFTSDEQGLATWEGPDDKVMFRLHGGSRASVQITARPNTGRDDITEVVMQNPLKVTVEATDAETGAPLKEFRVTEGLLWRKGGGTPVSWQSHRRGKPGKDGKWERTCTDGHPFYVFRVDAEGYAPAVSEPIAKDAGTVTVSLKLERAEPMTGVLVDADGAPVADADVHLGSGGQMIQVANGEVSETSNIETARTDEQGRFSFPQQAGEFLVVASTPAGYAQVGSVTFKESQGKIRLEPWGGVTGRLLVGSTPAGGETISAHPTSRGHQPGQPHVYFSLTTTTEQGGSFRLMNVPPGRVSVARVVRIDERQSINVLRVGVEVKAGQTATVTLGGTGRPVVGKLVLPDELAQLNPTIGSCRLSGQAKQAGFMRLMARLGGARANARTGPRHYGVIGAPDWGLRAENVDPGTYDLICHVNEQAKGRYVSTGRTVGMVRTKVVVPPLPDGVTYLDEPLDLGPLAVEPLSVKLSVGHAAAELSLPLLDLAADAPAIPPGKDAKKVSLCELHGKVVLLCFWGSSCAKSQAQVPRLKKIWETYGKLDQFAMIGIPFGDLTPKAPFEYAKKNGMPWPQTYVDIAARRTITLRYQLQGTPSVWILDPDGQVAGMNLDGEALTKSVDNAMAIYGK